MTCRPPQRRSCAPTGLLVAALAGAPAAAQPEPAPNRPDAAGRIVRIFDFNHPEKFALPEHWDLAQDGFAGAGPRPGFPIFNGAEHQIIRASSPDGSVRLWVKGGSTSLRLNPGVVPVFPETEYLVSARVQTRGLRGARAALTARFLDRTNRPIPGSESRSDLVTTRPDQWQTIVAPLRADFADAAYIQIDLEILQPEQFESPRLGAHQVWPQDFAGQAWFDDVAAVQIPKVEISTASPVNVLIGPQTPAIRILIRDLAGERLTGVLTLQDAAGAVIDTDTRILEGGRAEWSWEPRLARYGWYRVSLDLSTPGRRVGAAYVDMAWLPSRAQGTPSADRSRFGVIVADLPAPQRPLLPELVAATGAGSATIPAWSSDLTASSVPRLAQDLSPAIAALRAAGRRLSFSLDRVPEELAGATQAERDNPLAVFTRDQKLWAPYLVPLIDKYGQSVQRWQIGAITAAPRTGSAPGLEAAESFLAKLVPGPTVAAPWPAELAGPASLGPACGEAVVLVPAAFPPRALCDLASLWIQAAGPAAVTIVPEPLDPARFSRQDAAIDTAKRIVEFWRTLSPADPAAGARPLDTSVALVQPWSWPGPARQRILPHPELAVLANLIDRLEGRRIIGSLPGGRGVTCYMLEPIAPGRSGALVAWAAGDAPADAALDAFLGAGPVQLIDIWGNASPVATDRAPAQSDPSRAGPITHRIPLTSEPVFVENVDVSLARLLASFRLEPDAAENTGGDHDLAVVLTNPFKLRVDGRLTILEPGGLSGGPEGRDHTWRISPRVSTFSIPPGQTARIPIIASFGAVEEAGPKPFLVEIECSADRDYPPIRLRTSFEVRLDSLALDVSYRFVPTPTGPDLLLEAQATNHGRATSTIEISAYAPGFPRAKGSIADLAPGASAIRRFVFPGGAAALRGEKISVGAQDADSQARINRSVRIE